MKVKINPVVKYDWEQRRYVGNLIAVHLNRTHVAYVLRGINYNMETVAVHFAFFTNNYSILWCYKIYGS